MRITVYGAGYVGLVTSACLAEQGNDVLCMDIDAARVERLRAGSVPIHEPGLDTLLRANIEARRLRFTSDIEAAVEHACLQMIAVGTPPDEDGQADLSHVLAVARAIALHMREPRVIVEKSTVPVGTARRVAALVHEVLAERGETIEFHVVSNPEFLKEGAAVQDFLHPDRIVVGADNAMAAQFMKDLYAAFGRDHAQLLVMDTASAELTKYAANLMLATRISLMNELAGIARAAGADVEQVRLGIGSDPRIGPQFLKAGCGYGGSCFPKDVQALQRIADAFGVPSALTRAVHEVNERQKHVLFERVCEHLATDTGSDHTASHDKHTILGGRRVAVWGLAFKPDTDDMREAPSLALIEALLAAGASVRAYDPTAADDAERRFEGADYARLDSAEAVLDGADALVICTEWQQFRFPDFEAMRTRLRTPLVIDGRNLFAPEAMRARGFTYASIGRGDVEPARPGEAGRERVHALVTPPYPRPQAPQPQPLARSRQPVRSP